MSWYYTYYLAYRNKEDNKIYPLGPFDYKGRYLEVMTRSRSFEYGLNEHFNNLDYTALSDELKKAMRDRYERDENEKYWLDSAEEYSKEYPLSYCAFKDLPKSNYIRREYCLIDDITQFEKSEVDDEVYFERFYDTLTPSEYARKVENELKFGPPKPKKDCEGYDYTPHSCSEYSFYCWPDYDSMEYEAAEIKDFMGVFLEYPGLPKEFEPGILLSQG